MAISTVSGVQCLNAKDPPEVFYYFSDDVAVLCEAILNLAHVTWLGVKLGSKQEQTSILAKSGKGAVSSAGNCRIGAASNSRLKSDSFYIFYASRSGEVNPNFCHNHNSHFRRSAFSVRFRISSIRTEPGGGRVKNSSAVARDTKIRYEPRCVVAPNFEPPIVLLFSVCILEACPRPACEHKRRVLRFWGVRASTNCGSPGVVPPWTG
ncbi:hypothetical protein C8R43DRAFT_959404 [Mycena crocata]|nr:hypothetical protein C8R43DRAFT_959404 [Mycena crocata]